MSPDIWDLDTITIPYEEYEQLKRDKKFLECLYAAGVADWHGYDYANESMEEE